MAANAMLLERLRYAHSEGYVRGALDRAGLFASHFEEALLRTDRGNEITGYYVIAELK